MDFAQQLPRLDGSKGLWLRYKKAWESVLLLVPRTEAVALP